MQPLGTRKISALHATAFIHSVRWGQLGLGSTPPGPGARHFRAWCVSFSICKMGLGARLWAPVAARGAGRGGARPGGMLTRRLALRAARRGPGVGRGGGGSAPALSRREEEGRSTSCRVASRAARSRPLQPSLAEPAPPLRARPLHKRPWRRRTPTSSDLPQEEEGAERSGHSPPPRRCKSSPPPLRPLPPLTGNSCGLRATELAAVPGPASRTSYWSRQPNPSWYWAILSVTHHSSTQDSALRPPTRHV